MICGIFTIISYHIINGCVGPQGFNCHASSQSSIAELCAMLLAQDFFSCPYTNVIQRWPLRPVAELGINFCAPSRFLPIYQSIPICYAVLTFQAFCRPGHKFLCWLRPQEPAPWSLCHPELVIEVSFEVLAPQTSKSELALQA